MTEHRERVERALRGCAEAGMPETVDLWPGIRERVGARAVAGPRRRSRRVLPRTRMGWAVTALTMLFLSTAGFAATGWVDELFTDTAPAVGEANYAVPLNETRTVDGVTFTLEKAYADEGNVVVGYSIGGFEDWNRGYPVSGPPRISDESDAAFEYAGGLGVGTDPVYNTEGGERLTELAFFDPSEKIDPRGKHEFRLRLKLNPKADDRDQRDGAEEKQAAGPRSVVFDFEVPVRKLDVVEVKETVEANGFSMTLDRLENSPARAQAFLCFDPPQDEKYTWVPVINRPNIAESDVFSNESVYHERPEEPVGCAEYDLFRSVYDQPGRHSFTVTRLEGRTQSKVHPDKTINGPWRFTFEVPDPGK